MRRLLVVLITFVSVMVAVPAASAQDADPVPEDAPGERPTAVVSMGDSFIAGMAGRWEGNSSSNFGDRRGTDRAAYRRGWFWRYDPSRVYGDTVGGCYRSDVAPILSGNIGVDERINIACAGARTVNVYRGANGGEGQHGETPQGDQLAAVAQGFDVEMVVVSIGGNDLGYSDIIVDCTTSYIFRSGRCNSEQQAEVDARLGGVLADVSGALAEIRSIMTDAGYGPDDYRLVLQSYPSPVPSGDEFRFSEFSWRRTVTHGCPYYNDDATWARDSLVPQLSSGLATAAAEAGAEFLDLQDLYEGREVCSNGVDDGSGSNAEWGRKLTIGILQGDAVESLHPNAIGQRANGTCIELLFDSAPGSYTCNNQPGQGPEAVVLSASVASGVG